MSYVRFLPIWFICESGGVRHATPVSTLLAPVQHLSAPVSTCQHLSAPVSTVPSMSAPRFTR
eukprot:scaffold11870_cov49-Phaeocystis_antarctica.AAC.1